jgi:parallel beta-helix repeat protein
VAAVVAVVVGSGLVAAGSAAADVTDLWVNNGSAANCSDAGAGSHAQPYCTLATAAAAVLPGQTVHVSGTYHEHLTIAKSGTPDAPIVFTGDTGSVSVTGAGAGITIDGQHDVKIDHLAVDVPGGTGISVSGSSQIILTNTDVYITGTGAPAIALSAVTGATVTGAFTANTGGPGLVLDEATSGVTVRRLIDSPSGGASVPADGIDILGPDNAVLSSRVQRSGGAGIYIGPQADRTVLARNLVVVNRGLGIDVAGGASVAVTSNTVSNNCAGGIRVRGSASGASIQDNIVTRNGRISSADCQPDATPVGLGVYDSATVSSIVDYNIVYQPTSGEFPYAWGTPQATLADFQATSGQGQHDIQADPKTTSGPPPIGSPAIDSANSAAPGWQPGNPADDPDVPDTGAGPVTFADRGASELVPTVFVTVTMTPRLGDPVGGWPVTADASASKPGWGTMASYTVDFGDGAIVTSASPVVDHVYQAAGRYPVLISAVASDGRASAGIVESSVVVGDMFQPAGPVRVLDTRTKLGVPTSTPVPAHGTVQLRLAGVGGVPATGVVAVVLNTTVTATTAGGYLTVYPDGVTRPTTSNTNWTRGQTVANLVTVQVVNGVVDLYNGSSGTAHLVVDLAGYYAHSTGDTFSPATAPQRVLDTRTGLGGSSGAVPAHGTISLLVYPSGYSPVLNVTVTGGTASGYLTVYPHGQPQPVASNLNWAAGQTRANLVVVPSSDGSVSIYNGSNGPVQVIADALGSFGGSAWPFVPASPVRLLDTRTGSHPVPVAPYSTISLRLPPGINGIPARGAYAAVLTVTVTGGTAPGYLTVYPSSAPIPTASNLNWTKGATVANLVVVRTGDSVSFYNGSSGTVHVIVDLVGSYTN